MYKLFYELYGSALHVSPIYYQQLTSIKSTRRLYNSARDTPPLVLTIPIQYHLASAPGRETIIQQCWSTEQLQVKGWILIKQNSRLAPHDTQATLAIHL